MFEKLFRLKEKNTTVMTEIMAGITTFMAVSYIIFINPAVLEQAGMDRGAVYVATILASAIGTLIMGLFANVPYVQSAGIGLNALFTYTLCGTLGFTWEQALAMVFVCGVINILVTVTSVRTKVIKAMPEFMQNAITVGIGLFITYIGLKSSGIINFTVPAVNPEGIALAGDVVPQLANFTSPEIILALIGFVLTTILVSRKTKNAYLLSIVLTALIGIPLGVTAFPDFGGGISIPSIAPTFLKLDFAGLFTAKAGLVAVVMSIFTLTISDLFDTIGTFVGTGKKAGIFEVDENGNMSKNLERAMVCDSLSTVIGSMLGTSNVVTYVESSVGIEAGGRTGLTSVSAAVCFLLSLFLAPIVACVPAVATAPILMFIGISMIENIVKIDWKDILVAIPAFFIIMMMPLAYSITTGIQFGFILYIIVNVANGKGKQVSPMIYIFSLLFIVDFVYRAIS